MVRLKEDRWPYFKYTKLSVLAYFGVSILVATVYIASFKHEGGAGGFGLVEFETVIPVQNNHTSDQSINTRLVNG